jgi:hypothetical protein
MSSYGDLLGKPLMDFSEIIRFHPLDDGDDIADLIFETTGLTIGMLPVISLLLNTRESHAATNE